MHTSRYGKGMEKHEMKIRLILSIFHVTTLPTVCTRANNKSSTHAKRANHNMESDGMQIIIEQYNMYLWCTPCQSCTNVQTFELFVVHISSQECIGKCETF